MVKVDNRAPSIDNQDLTRVRARGELVRKFILSSLPKHADDIARFTAEHFQVSRQAANTHLRHLLEKGAIQSSGSTTRRPYELVPLLEWDEGHALDSALTEDAAWRTVSQVLGSLPKNVHEIWQFGFTEMFNNAIDHSGGNRISVHIR